MISHCKTSFGGGLVINFAHDYPEQFTAIIASSALTRFAFETPEYAGQARINLGPKLADRLRVHMAALKPARPYDETWVDRERIFALISGLSQIEELQPVKPLAAAAERQGNYNWYTWKYQQCTQTGTFFTGRIFPHTRADHIADCRATFGEAPGQSRWYGRSGCGGLEAA